MTCESCRKRFSSRAQRCPHCGRPNPAIGVFQTSTVLVASSREDAVYRSVEDVPDPLRAKLIKSTNGANSATILIADRRGREEIARAMRSLPGPMQRRIMQAVTKSGIAADTLRWFTPRRRALALAVLVLLLAVLVGALFPHR